MYWMNMLCDLFGCRDPLASQVNQVIPGHAAFLEPMVSVGQRVSRPMLAQEDLDKRENREKAGIKGFKDHPGPPADLVLKDSKAIQDWL